MPWRGPERPGEFPSLGYQVADFIEANCAIPDGEHAGEPFVLTEGQLRFVVWHYRLKPDAMAGTGKPSAAFHFARGSLLVRPQKWGKGPLSAAVVCAEAEGPVLFDGWDADGEPVGRPWATPWIQVTAVSEDQTDNIWRALVPMIEMGSIAADMPDTGETRINLRGGGRVEPVTASARSRLGQRITFAPQDELQSWLQRNGGWALADNQRRNLAGMGGRFMGTGNAYDPTEQSDLQRLVENPVGVYVDYPQPPAGSVRNKRERRKVLRAVYGDAPHVDIDRIDIEIESLLATDPPQAERYFLNRAQAGESVAFDAARWAQLADSTIVVPDEALVVIGVDGARFDDAVAVVATDIEQSFQWPLVIIERPPNAPDDYEHDLGLIDGAITEAMDRLSVWRIYIDPQKIGHLVTKWAGQYGEGRIQEWYTNRPRQIAYAVRNYRSSMTAGDFHHDGDPTFAKHIANARRMSLNVKDEDGRPMYSIQKDRAGSPNKIDAAMAAVISWEARSDAITAGAKRRRRAYRAAGF
jgi:hypothetical protein